MTLRELLELLSRHPAWILIYFSLLPTAAVLSGILGRGEGHLNPWKYIYSGLIYLVCIPGIFAVTLSVYLFLFERSSILDTNIYAQVVPVLSMVATLTMIRQNVDFDFVPGFQKISGLLLMIASTLILMWLADRMRVIVFSFLPFQYVLLIFLVVLFAIRFGWSRMFQK